MIEAQGLVKWYGPTLAVDHLSFSIDKGRIVGFLGPNGAGKSTTLRMLTGFVPPTAGRASIAGFDVMKQSADARQRIGYLPESTPLYGEMRVEEYLDYRGRLLAMPRTVRRERIGVVCERCGLAHLRRRLIGQLSKGNRQRVGLAQALLHNPRVLILDEPTAGLDPTQISHVRDLIRELKGDHTILLSSHILPEIEKTADDVMIIAGGRIVAQGTPEELRQSLAGGARILVEVKAAQDAVRNVFTKAQGVESVEVTATGDWARAMVSPRDGQDLREALGGIAAANGWTVREISRHTRSLEEFFIEVIAQQDQAAAQSDAKAGAA